MYMVHSISIPTREYIKYKTKCQLTKLGVINRNALLQRANYYNNNSFTNYLLAFILNLCTCLNDCSTHVV